MALGTILYFNIFSARFATSIRRKNDDANNNSFPYIFLLDFIGF